MQVSVGSWEDWDRPHFVWGLAPTTGLFSKYYGGGLSIRASFSAALLFSAGSGSTPDSVM